MNTDKKKIAIVLEATLGGTRKHVIDLISGLNKEKYDIYFYYSMYRADPSFIVNIEKIRKSCFQFTNLPMRHSLFSIKNLAAIFKFRKIIESESFDVIHLHGAIAGGIGRFAVLLSKFKGKVIYTPHGGVFHHFKGFKGRIYKSVELLLAKVTDQYIAVSSEQRGEICSGLKVKIGKVDVIHNGIKLEEDFDNLSDLSLPNDVKKQLENQFIVLFPALFLPAKGHINFFNSIIKNGSKFNDNVTIILAGDGPLLSEVKNLIETDNNLQKRVLFIGFVNNLKTYFKICDLVILPSNAEAFGYVLLEAFLFKKAVFCTKVGGILDIVDDGRNGRLFSPNDLKEMIECINYYSTRNEELKKFGEEGFKDLANKFSDKIMVERYNKIYSYD